MTKPVIKVASANVKMAELTGSVTVGNEITRQRLSKALGREVQMGETVDLGTLAYHHKNPLKRLWRTFRIKRNPLNSV